ncbi:hypothetical protein BDL97_15G052400 [Sphagnum fallax]|nr:hypothetical protein BDL97_15G052400 [Sphagnum fallax]
MEHELPLAQQVAIPNLVAHYMSRIWNLNPLVNAVVEACAPEEEEAAEQDSFTEEQIISKAFFGLPFLVKDSLDVLGFHTTCGASVYEHNAPADGDCKLVALLKKLRAIPIGKTNVPFLCQDMQTFNEVYGTTFNPYDAKLSSGGSCGGSAAAIALGLAAFAIGTDWNGSLRIPAAFCGVSSLRASRGRLTVDGSDRVLPHIPPNPCLTGEILVSGIFTRTVVDLKFLMSTLLPFLPSGEFQEDEESSFLGGAVNVGVWTSFNGVPLDTRIRDHMEAIPSMLEASNVAVNNSRLVVRAELTNGPSLDMARLHKALQVFTHNWDEFDVELSSDRTKKLEAALAVQYEGGTEVDRFLKFSGYAAVLTPVSAVLPHEHNYEHRPLKVNGVDVPYWRALTGYVAPFSVTGNPVVTMPLCVIDGRPCGIQVVGRRGCDRHLLDICAYLEQQFAYKGHLHMN